MRGPGGDFIRGFVATGLLAAFDLSQPPVTLQARLQRSVRPALRGGLALAVGTAAVEAIEDHDYAKLLVSVVAGASALNGLNRALCQPGKQLPKGEQG